MDKSYTINLFNLDGFDKFSKDLNKLVEALDSKEFMKFLYGYQKDEFKPKEPPKYEIRFKTPRSGKLAKVYVTEEAK